MYKREGEEKAKKTEGNVTRKRERMGREKCEPENR